MTSIHTWSLTASENDDADSAINWAELQDPDTVNNSARAMMQRLAEWRDDISIARLSSGATDTYEVTAASSPVALVDGMQFIFRAHQTNVGASTLKINAFAAKPLRAKTETNLSEGDIQTGAPVVAFYNLAADEFLIANSGFFVHQLLPSLLSTYALNTLIPVGAVMPYPVATVPAGWLEANGASVSTTAYSELFAKYGYSYGGSGSSFNLPDYRGEFLRGYDNGAGNDPDAASRTDRGDGAAGDVVGSKQGDQNKQHNHTASTTVTVSNAGDHTHNIDYIYQSVSSGVSGGQRVRFNSPNAIQPTTSAGDHTHPASGLTTVDNAGGSESRSRNVNVMWIIFAKPSAALAEMQGLTGLPYVFDDGITDVDPGSGRLSWDNATLSLATEVYVSETGPNAESFGPILSTWDDFGSSAVRGHLYITKVGEPTTFAHFALSGSETDQGTYRKWSISLVSGGGTFADNDNLNVLFTGLGTEGPAGGTPVASSATSLTVNNAEDVTAANTSAATYTLASGLTWCVVSRSSASTADVTVISADSPTKTIDGNADGVILNAVAGPVRFRVDPSNANNYITSVPAVSAPTASTREWVGNKTVAELNALTGTTEGAAGYATDGRKNGEGVGSGTGVEVFRDASNWIACDTGATVAA